MPLPFGTNNSEHGLLGINHEYTTPELMFANWFRMENREKLEGDKKTTEAVPVERGTTPEETQVELAAHGHTVIEVRKENGTWRVVDGSPYARRITLRGRSLNAGAGTSPRKR
jgi:hypothetical protein